MTVVKQFCCCCQLRTGAVLLAWMGLVFELFELTATGAAYANRYLLLGDVKYEHDTDYVHQVILIIVSFTLPLYMAIVILNVVCYICMGLGAIKGNRFLLLPWLFLELVTMVLFVLFLIIGGLTMMIYGGAVFMLIWLFGLPLLALKLYLWLCVLSCFQDLRDSLKDDGNQPLLLQYPKPVQDFLGYHRVEEHSASPA